MSELEVNMRKLVSDVYRNEEPAQRHSVLANRLVDEWVNLCPQITSSIFGIELAHRETLEARIVALLDILK